MCQDDTDAPAQGHPHPHAGILQKKKKKKKKKKISWNNVTPEGHKVCVIEYILS